MKKVFALEDLDCANCALKMENAIAKIPGVSHVSVSYMTQKMTLEAPDADFQNILKEAIRTISRVEPDCRVIVR